MELTFLGTRGEIREKSDDHKMHSSLLVTQGETKLLIDYGETFRKSGVLQRIKPTYVLLTHAHPDHAFGLKDVDLLGLDVWMISAVWETLPKDIREIIDKKELHRYEWNTLGDFKVRPIPVTHSVKCPTNGFIITDGKVTIGYFPDVLAIRNREVVLKGLDLYIGDGSALDKPIVRRHAETGRPIGHASMKDQVRWCSEAGVKRAIFTHCGKDVVTSDKTKLTDFLEELSKTYGIKVSIAKDSQRVSLSSTEGKIFLGKPGIYLVPPHGQLIIRGKKTLIVSAKPAPEDYLNKPIYLVEDGKVLGTLVLTKVRGPYNADLVRTRLRNRHRITDEEWDRWASKYPKWNEEVYVIEFEKVTPFDEPIPIKISGVQKWIRNIEIKIPVRKLISPAEVKEVLKNPEILKEWSDKRLLDDHRICHLWSGKNWKTLPKDLTKSEVRRLHALIVAEMHRRGMSHNTPLARSFAVAAEDNSLDAQIAKFGRAPWFYVNGDWMKNTNRTGVETAEWISNLVSTVICKDIGFASRQILKEHGVSVETLDGTVREALESLRRPLVVQGESIEEILKKVNQPSPFAPVHHKDTEQSITLEEVLKAWEKPIVLKKGYITLVGGLPSWGSTSNDIDVFIKDREWVTHIHQPLLFRLGRALPGNLGEKIQLLFAGEYGGIFTSHIPIYDLVLVPSADRRLIRMETPIVALAEDAGDLEGIKDVIIIPKVERENKDGGKVENQASTGS